MTGQAVVNGRSGAIRVAISGASHWHLSLYLPTLLELEDVRVVAVSDSNIRVAAEISDSLGCAPYDDYREMCFASNPDFVLAFEQHANMYALGVFLAEQRIPFIMEKPCGVSYEEVANLAAACASRNVFAAVPFVWRLSELVGVMRERFDDDAINYLMLRWIAGTPQRYLDSDCAWMLDSHSAGGGCTLNLSVHLLDLARVLMGPEIRVENASMSARAFGYDVEDYSNITLRSGSKRATIETGYLLPATHSTFDMHFSVVAGSHYLVAQAPDAVTITDADGCVEQLKAAATNVQHYPVFVRDTLRRWRRGEPPVAGMEDMVHVMRLVEDAYRLAGSITD